LPQSCRSTLRIPLRRSLSSDDWTLFGTHRNGKKKVTNREEAKGETRKGKRRRVGYDRDRQVDDGKIDRWIARDLTFFLRCFVWASYATNGFLYIGFHRNLLTAHQSPHRSEAMVRKKKERTARLRERQKRKKKRTKRRRGEILPPSVILSSLSLSPSSLF
jgi:hypothetical protein